MMADEPAQAGTQEEGNNIRNEGYGTSQEELEAIISASLSAVEKINFYNKASPYLARSHGEGNESRDGITIKLGLKAENRAEIKESYNGLFVGGNCLDENMYGRTSLAKTIKRGLKDFYQKAKGKINESKINDIQKKLKDARSHASETEFEGGLEEYIKDARELSTRMLPNDQQFQGVRSCVENNYTPVTLKIPVKYLKDKLKKYQDDIERVLSDYDFRVNDDGVLTWPIPSEGQQNPQYEFKPSEVAFKEAVEGLSEAKTYIGEVINKVENSQNLTLNDDGSITAYVTWDPPTPQTGSSQRFDKINGMIPIRPEAAAQALAYKYSKPVGYDKPQQAAGTSAGSFLGVMLGSSLALTQLKIESFMPIYKEMSAQIPKIFLDSFS